MSGFLDRLAARAVGDAPLVHPRVRSRHEPDAGVLPGEPVEEIAQVEEVAAAVAAPRVEVRGPAAEPRTFEKIPEAHRMESSPPDPLSHLPPSPRRERGNPVPAPVPEEMTPPLPGSDSVRYRSDSRSTAEPPRVGLEKVPAATTSPEKTESRLRRDPHPLTPSPTRTHTHAGEGEPEKAFVSSPPLPVEGSADGRGGRGVRVHRAAPPEELPAEPLRAEERLPAAPPPLRPRSALAAELPTVEADRGAPLPPSLEESEPSETVVHVSIGRIDVRANQPAAPERRPSRPAGPRLSLGDYLKRREERRR